MNARKTHQSRRPCNGPEREVAHQHRISDPAGKVYLLDILSGFDGLVISWTLEALPAAALVNAMLNAAIETMAGPLSTLIVEHTIAGPVGY